MPWPFSESIKKRACRYLLQRYLGHFLQEKLSLEQLSLDLYQGTGSLTQVPLDKWCLNEILESADAPLEVTDGFIQSISLSVPWGSLLQDNCALEVKGLEMVFRPRPRLGRLIFLILGKEILYSFSESKVYPCFRKFLALFKLSFSFHTLLHTLMIESYKKRNCHVFVSWLSTQLVVALLNYNHNFKWL